MHAALAGGCPSTVRRMRQQTLNVLMSQRKAGPPPGLKGSKKIGSLKMSMHSTPQRASSPSSMGNLLLRPARHIIEEFADKLLKPCCLCS